MIHPVASPGWVWLSCYVAPLLHLRRILTWVDLAQLQYEEALDGAGVLFDCHAYGGPITRQVDLQSPKPMQLAGLWSCVHAALRCSSEVSSALKLPGSQVGAR